MVLSDEIRVPETDPETDNKKIPTFRRDFFIYFFSIGGKVEICAVV